MATHPADLLPLRESALNARFVSDRAAGVVSLDPPRRKVLIYGAGAGRREAKPLLRDPTWEVWALNLIVPLVPEEQVDGQVALTVRADRWFELHQRIAQTADDLRFIAGNPRPVYVPPDLLDGGPTCVRFPLERIRERFGADAGCYFACTFAYEMALALLEGFTDIGLYGVELALGTRREATVEWACVSWWLGYASARGVRIHQPSRSRLGRHRFLYGYEYAAEIDEVAAYLRGREDYERQELRALDWKRRGIAATGPASVGG